MHYLNYLLSMSDARDSQSSLFQRGNSDVMWKSFSCVRLSVTPWTPPWNSPGQNTGVGILPFLSPGDFPNLGTEPGSPTLQADSLPAESQGRPGTLEWVAYPFSRGSSQPRNRTRVFCIAGGFFTNWAIREARINRHECEQALGVGDGQGGLVCCIPWGRKESDTTEWLNWSELRMGEASSCYVWNRPEGSGLLHL